MKLNEEKINKINNKIQELCEDAYSQGCNDVKLHYDEAVYQNGFNDAWEIANKIINSYEYTNVFGDEWYCNKYQILDNYTGIEVLNIIKEYNKENFEHPCSNCGHSEEDNTCKLVTIGKANCSHHNKWISKMEIGDEVIDKNDNKAIITMLNKDKTVCVIWLTGDGEVVDKCNLMKTGKHYDVIKKIFGQIEIQE